MFEYLVAKNQGLFQHSFTFLKNRQAPHWTKTIINTVTKLKQYLVLNMEIKKNNFFAAVSKKIFEVPQKITSVFNFLSNLKRKFKEYIKERVVYRQTPALRKTGKTKTKVKLRTHIKKEINKPRPVEAYTLVQIFHSRNQLIRWTMSQGFYAASYFNIYSIIPPQFFSEIVPEFVEKVITRVKFWYRGAVKPYIPRPRWLRLLKKMKYNRKKLFKVIKNKLLYKKKLTFSLQLLRRRARKMFITSQALQHNLFVVPQRQQNVMSLFHKMCFDFISYIKFNMLLTQISPELPQQSIIQDTFLTLKRRLSISYTFDNNITFIRARNSAKHTSCCLGFRR
jgi:hypothetical protein